MKSPEVSRLHRLAKEHRHMRLLLLQLKSASPYVARFETTIGNGTQMTFQSYGTRSQ
jgi:hypothetical protein